MNETLINYVYKEISDGRPIFKMVLYVEDHLICSDSEEIERAKTTDLQTIVFFNIVKCFKEQWNKMDGCIKK